MQSKSEAEHYESEQRREHKEILEKHEAEIAETVDIFKSYGLSQEQISPIVDTFRNRPETWVDFMMRFELGLEKPDPRRAPSSGLNIAAAYVAGGLIPMAPYMFIPHAPSALWPSIAVTLISLIVFGSIKGRFTGTKPSRSALQTTLIGGVAAAVAFLVARIIS